MMFGQLSNRESLRDLIVAMEAHAGKLYHLGIGKSVTRSNLSKANERRDCRIFEEYATFMIAEARKRRINKILDGPSFVNRKVESNYIRSTILKQKFLRLCILHLLTFTIQRLCPRFLTNLETKIAGMRRF